MVPAAFAAPDPERDLTCRRVWTDRVTITISVTAWLGEKDSAEVRVVVVKCPAFIKTPTLWERRGRARTDRPPSTVSVEVLHHKRL
jgi:hypothetical protein